MSRKFYFITIAVTLFVSSVTVFIFVYFSNKNKEQATVKVPENSESEQGFLPISEIVKKNKLEIPINKENIEIDNIYKKLKKELSNNGVAFENNSNYYMAFYPSDNSFVIALLNNDIEFARKEAERGFLEDLKISQEQACKLNVILSIPYDVNPELSGKNYGLSFCTGSISF